MPCDISILLEEYNSHGDKGRFGSYSFQDKIKIQLNVDWDKIHQILVNSPQLQMFLIQNVFNFIIKALRRNSVIKRLMDNLQGSISMKQLNSIEKKINRIFGFNITAPSLTQYINKLSLLKQNEFTTATINKAFTVLGLSGFKQYIFFFPSTYTVLHNTTSPHGIACYTASLVTSAYKECTDDSTAGYVNRNHPLPLTTGQSLEIKVIIAILASVFILIPLCYIPAAFVTFVVRERVSKSKHLQIVSSVSPYLYWASTYIWDMMLFLILDGCVMIAFFIYGGAASSVFVSDVENSLAVFFLLVLYGASSLPLSYIYSFAFENHSTAQINVMTIHFVTGFVAVLAYYIMITIPETEAAGETAANFFRFFPPYNMGEGLVNLSAAYYQNYLSTNKISYLSWEVAGRNICFMGVEAIGYLSIVLISESEAFKGAWFFLEQLQVSSAESICPPLHEDEDVILEQQRMNKLDPGEISLYMRNLTKTYPSSIFCGKVKHAVRGVSLGCSVGETFGLLGINGAGKSTTLGILTGDIRASTGDVYIAGLPISSPLTRKAVGYCPQVDPLLDLMTGYETLWFFGRIRGVEPQKLTVKVSSLIDEVGLAKHAHKPCGTYSGGNKRKLSLAVSLIGDPKVLFLDEVRVTRKVLPILRVTKTIIISYLSRQRLLASSSTIFPFYESAIDRYGS